MYAERFQYWMDRQAFRFGDGTVIFHDDLQPNRRVTIGRHGPGEEWYMRMEVRVRNRKRAHATWKETKRMPVAIQSVFDRRFRSGAIRLAA